MNSRHSYAAALLVASLLLPGCGLKTQYLHLDPEIRVGDSQIGAGQIIGLAVADNRENKKLGEVGDPLRKMVDVLLEEDPSPFVYDRVKIALMRLGFAVVPYDDTRQRTMKVEIRKLELQSQKTPVTFETELRAEVAAHAVNVDSRYDRQVNVRTHKDGAVPPYEKDSAALVNTAVSQALEDLLADEALLSMLAK